jgi:hypothetical protein
MTRRSVWVVEVLSQRTGRYVVGSLHLTRATARAGAAMCRRFQPKTKPRVVPYTPKGGEEESDG